MCSPCPLWIPHIISHCFLAWIMPESPWTCQAWPRTPRSLPSQSSAALSVSNIPGWEKYVRKYNGMGRWWSSSSCSHSVSRSRPCQCHCGCQELRIVLSARASLSNINLFVDIEISADFAVVVQHFSSCQRILHSFYFQSRTNDTLWIISKTSKGWQKMTGLSSTTWSWTRTPGESTSGRSTSSISSPQTWNPR